MKHSPLSTDAAAMTPPLATLERWLTGPRFAGLPVRDATHPAPLLSFEFFPPRTEALEAQLWSCIRRLERLRPRFVSVTYGAGGSTQSRTHAIVTRIARETRLVPAAHLTCVGGRAGGESTTWRASIGRRACATSWRCAATCRAAGPMRRIPAATPMPPTWSPG